MAKTSKPKGGTAGQKSGIRGDTKPLRRNVLTKRKGATKYVVIAPPPEGPGLVTTLRPAAYPVIRKMAGSGRTLTAIAAALGLTRRSFKTIRDKDPKAEKALEVGVADLDAEVTDIILAQARKGSIVAAIFYAKARLGWVEGSAAPMGVNIDKAQINITIPPAMSQADAEALIAKSGVTTKLHPTIAALENKPTEPKPKIIRG